MAKTLSDIQTNCGNSVQDTSSALATKIAVWANDSYEKIWDRAMWSATINNDYTFESVATQDAYDLPLDFREELFVANIADGTRLKRFQEGQWWRERYGAYSGDSIDAGSAHRYIIHEEQVNSTNTGFGKLQLDPAPTEAEAYAMPYKRRFCKLLNTTGT